MRKSNTRTTRTEQDRTEAALKRRAKRKQARDKLLEPYIKLLTRKDEQIAKLVKEHGKQRLAVAEKPDGETNG